MTPKGEKKVLFEHPIKVEPVDGVQIKITAFRKLAITAFNQHSTHSFVTQFPFRGHN